MHSKIDAVTKRVILSMLVAGVSSVAIADDSSISRFGGDSYAFLNKQRANSSANSWLRTHPNGPSERTLQAESASSASPAWQLEKPVFTGVTSAPRFTQTHPNGLTDAELRALSSEAPVWHQNASTPTP